MEKLDNFEIGSIIFTGLTIFIGFFTSFDPFGDLNLLDARILVVCSLAEAVVCGSWGLINGAHRGKLVLVIAGKKLKEDGEDHVDNFDILQYVVGVIWFLFGMITFIACFTDENALVAWYVWVLLLGVLASTSLISYSGIKASDRFTPLDPLDPENEMKIKGRRKTSGLLAQLFGHHVFLVILFILDIALGVPVGDSSNEVGADLEFWLIVSGVYLRLFASFQLWFHWLGGNEAFKKHRLAERRKQYKVISVERKIDERIIKEQERLEKGDKTYVDATFLQKTTVYTEDEYDPQNSVRTRGATQAYIQNEAQRMITSQRSRANLGTKGKEAVPLEEFGSHLNVSNGTNR